MDPSSGNLWLAFKEPTMRVYDLSKPAQPQHTITSHSEWVAAIEMCEPGIVVSASADKTLRVWKLPSLKSSMCSGHLDFVTCLTVVPNEDDSGYLVASGSCDKTIRLWDIKSVVRMRRMCFKIGVFGHTFFPQRIAKKALSPVLPRCTATLVGCGQFVQTARRLCGAVAETARCEIGIAKLVNV